MAILIGLATSSLAECRSEYRLVTVTGEGEVEVVPDEVVLTLGVETWDRDLTAAKDKNDRRVEGIIKVAKEHGIGEEHIQTDYISIEPRYKDQWEHREFIAYFVRKAVVITLRDTAKFEGLLSHILDVGANYVHGIQFRTTEVERYKGQARSLAVRNAREKAGSLAQELGQMIGRPYQIQENQSGWWSWYNTAWGARFEGAVAQRAAPAPDSSTAIALGRIKINANVLVSFELIPKDNSL